MYKQNTWQALFYVLYNQIMDEYEAEHGIDDQWMDMEMFIADYAYNNEDLIWV